MQQLTQLLAPPQFSVKLKEETKQTFFATRKNQKRMKTSLCFSEQPDRNWNGVVSLDLSVTSLLSQDTAKGQYKELDSTFAEDTSLSFKIKQPKRKVNSKIVHNKQNNNENIIPTGNQLEILIHSTIAIIQNQPPSTTPNQQIHSQAQKRESFQANDFLFLEKIGEGSYSEVFKAVEKRTGFVCAVKVMLKTKMRELDAQQNIQRQLKIQAFADHPHIAKLYTFFSDKHYLYLVTQYSTDKNLYNHLYQPKLKLKKGIRTDEAAQFSKQICNAIQYLHSRHIIHRDIKPENILLTINNTVKICDFGWSIYNPTQTLRTTICGTPLYLAPELIAQSEYDESVDIWAIGVIVYQMLTEESPFKIERASDLRKIVQEEVRLERIRNKQAASFIECALQKEVCKRIDISALVRHPFLG